jgi:hypothetical protein
MQIGGDRHNRRARRRIEWPTLMGQLVRSELVSAGFTAITAVATLATTALLLYFGFRLYDREEILFPQ